MMKSEDLGRVQTLIAQHSLLKRQLATLRDNQVRTIGVYLEKTHVQIELGDNDPSPVLNWALDLLEERKNDIEAALVELGVEVAS